MKIVCKLKEEYKHKGYIYCGGRRIGTKWQEVDAPAAGITMIKENRLVEVRESPKRTKTTVKEKIEVTNGDN